MPLMAETHRAPGARAVDYCIVGAGIVGLSVARQILLQRPGATLAVVDKEPAVAAHQTGHNSGVVHAGLYYRPGSAKALLCRRGVGLLREFCADKGLTYDPCGKVVVALARQDEVALEAMLARSLEVGVPGVHLVGPSGIRDLEPHAAGRAALVSPTTAIVDYSAIARAIADEVVERGGSVILSTTVRGLREHADRVSVTTDGPTVSARQLVTCAGLQADRISRGARHPGDVRIVPFRGEYYRLRADRRSLVRSLLYPVPDPRYPFLGVHFTRTVEGFVDVGPNAVLALSREGYRWRDVDLAELAGMAGWPGTWRMAKRNWRAGVSEVVGSLSKHVYAHRARRYLPALRTRDLVPAAAGVRAQAVDRAGTLLDDFVFSRHGRVFSVANAPSPAATASLAIAEHIVEGVLRGAA